MRPKRQKSVRDRGKVAQFELRSLMSLLSQQLRGPNDEPPGHGERGSGSLAG